jgi:hypothetical protein
MAAVAPIAIMFIILVLVFHFAKRSAYNQLNARHR